MQDAKRVKFNIIKNKTPLAIIFLTIIDFLFIKISIFLLALYNFDLPIWPVTGINLALILMFGYRVWPAILFASLLGYMDFDALSSDNQTQLLNYQLDILLSTTSVIHAVFGAWLVQLFKCYHNSFSQPKEILKFYFVAGPITAFVGSTLAVSISVYYGSISYNDFYQEWFTWWLADVVSICIFTTITIALMTFDNVRSIVVTTVSLLAYTLTVVISNYGSKWDNERLDLLLEKQTIGIEELIYSSKDRYEAILITLDGLIRNPQGFNSKDFNSYSKSILPYNPSLLSINWNQFVTFNNIAQFAKDLSNEYNREITLMEVKSSENAPNELVPIEKREEYVFVKYIESFENLEHTIGLDQASYEARNYALKFAEKTRMPTMTSPVQRRFGDQDIVVSIYYASYEDDNLLGYSTIVIKMGLLLESLLASPFLKNLDVMIWDNNSKEPPIQLIKTSPNMLLSTFDRQIQIPFLNRKWTININKNQSFYELNKSIEPMIISFSGMITASILSIVIVIIMGQRIHLEGLVKIRTKELEKANLVKSEFMANMSHDLRTPLNAIIGFSEIMTKQLFGAIGSEKYEGYVKNIYDSSQYLLSLINDILDLSVLEFNERTLNKEELDLSELIREIDSQLKSLSDAKNINIKLKLQSSPQILSADKKALQQILINLISNAIKFTPDGGTINISTVSSRTNMTIEISDNGIGISKEGLNKIGKPFTRSNDTSYLSDDGTGLGLSIVSALVKLHGGELRIASELTKGTTVSIILPL